MTIKNISKKDFWASLLLLTIILVSFFFFGKNNDNKNYLKAEVLKVEKPIVKENSEDSAFSQKIVVESENEKEVKILNDYTELKKGQKIFIKKQEYSDEYRVIEIDRISYNFLFLIIFIITIFSFMGKKAIKSILSLVFSGLLILFFLIPMILKGGNIFIWSMISAIIILSFAMFFTHGINKKTIAAFSGTVVVIIVTGLLSLFAVKLMNFSGLADENAFNLHMMGIKINFSELLLSGILIGIIGMLDDVAITQASIVQELKDLNLRKKEIYKRAMIVGREHIEALVNTIVLAYAGAFFPLIIWFYNSKEPLEFLLSREIISAEIIRILIGSTGLMLTVPLVTIISIFIIKKRV